MQKVFSRKLLILSAISLCIFSFSFVASASMVIFSDGFESDFSNWTGNDPKWDTSGGNVYGGVKRGEVKGNTEPGDDVLLKNISTSGYDGIALEFWYRVKESLEDDDHVYVEWTADGSNWNVLNNFTSVVASTAWQPSSHTLPAEAGDKANFAIRFRAHLGAVTSDIFYLDDVVVAGNSGASVPSPTSEPTLIPFPSPSPSPSVASTPIPSAGSTNSPQATPAPPTPTPMSNPSPKPSILSSPLSTPSASSGQAAIMPSKNPTPTPVIISSPKPHQSSQESPNKDLTVASQSLELDQEANIATSEVSDSLSASISHFFNNSKFFWLMSIMVLAVVFSLAKFKNN